MTKYFQVPFSDSGTDRVEIPNIAQSDGSVSYQTGWGVDYQKKLGTDANAKPVSRQGTNGILHDITSAIQQYQQNGFFPFVTEEMNGGNPFPYTMGATVSYDMSQDGSDVRVFASKINENIGNPKDDTDDWVELTNPVQFATSEEAQAQVVTGKAIDPKTLGSVTATNNRAGLIKIASKAESILGVDSAKALTPSAFSEKNLTGNGYQILPGGLIIQWLSISHGALTNEATVSFNFPLSFNTVFQVYLSSNMGFPQDGTTTPHTEGAEILSFNSSGGVITSGWNSRREVIFRVFAIGAA